MARLPRLWFVRGRSFGSRPRKVFRPGLWPGRCATRRKPRGAWTPNTGSPYESKSSACDRAVGHPPNLVSTPARGYPRGNGDMKQLEATPEHTPASARPVEAAAGRASAAGILLAAGTSSRMGANKLFLE